MQVTAVAPVLYETAWYAHSCFVKLKMLRFVAILVFLASVLAFRHQTTRLRLPRLFQAIQVCSENELTNNNRIVVDTSQGAVVVTKIMDKYFAVNAKCPHLGTLTFNNISLSFNNILFQGYQ